MTVIHPYHHPIGHATGTGTADRLREEQLASLLGGGRHDNGDMFTGDQAVPGGELVDDGKGNSGTLGGLDHDRHGRYVVAELQKVVIATVRRVLAVEAP
jgi:hypothetical protein